MRQLIKNFLWIGLLAFSLQSAWAFSLLGPVGSGEDSTWQITEIGYNPLTLGSAPPFFTDGMLSGPKNLNEGYRPNLPMVYYTFDSSFYGYFGSDGENAVDQAFRILNSLTNVDSYSTNLSEFPLNSESPNYQAQALGLLDLKSMTLSILVEEMGLADSVRYTWCLIDRYILPSALNCVPADYYVIQRNYDYYLTPLDQIQYSPYINGELYSYYIYENCDAPMASPPSADALEIPADPINNNPPVASGHGEDMLPDGYFYTGLTRDDVAGLRWLISTNNYFSVGPGYRETPATGSQLIGGSASGSTTNYLTTLNFTIFGTNQDGSFTLLSFMDPATLQTNVPGIVITSVATTIVNGRTNYIYTFANLAPPYSFSTNNVMITQIQTTIIGLRIGQPCVLNAPVVTNPPSITVTSNIVNGVSADFYVIPTNSCGITVLGVLSNIVIGVTNNLGTITNIVPHCYSSDTVITSTNIITFSTNHVLAVSICTVSTNGATNAVVGDYQGIGRIQFVRVPDANYDYQSGQFLTAQTNRYTNTIIVNGALATLTFQRVVTRPDIVFQAENLIIGGNGIFTTHGDFTRTTPNFVNSRAAIGFAGPGTIDLGATNIAITFNTVGPIFVNSSPDFLTGPDTSLGRDFIWGSFDGTTNAPIVYPNGTSIANLAAEALIRISPATLPDGTNGVPYSVTLSATGGQPPYTWSLAPDSAGLPPGLTLSSGGVISGTPTESGTFDYILIRMTDTPLYNKPSYTVDTTYSMTIH